MVTAQDLKSVPLFSGLPKKQLSALMAFATLRRYPRNSVVLRAGAKASGLYVLMSGRAKILIADDAGREVILSHLEAPDFFGEMGLFDDRACLATVQTLAPSVLLHMSKADFMRCLSTNLDLAIRITRALIKRLRDADRQIESLALMDVYGRVARVLTDLAEKDDGRPVIVKPPSQQEIASMIGATREMVNRVMKDLQATGHILVDKRRIVLLDKMGTRRPPLIGL